MIDWSFEQVACEALDITYEQLRGKERVSDNASLARYFCFYYLVNTSNWSYGKIGDRYGGRDHSTVNHGMGVIDKFLETKDKRFSRAFSYFLERVDIKEKYSLEGPLTARDVAIMNFMVNKGISKNEVADLFKCHLSTLYKMNPTLDGRREKRDLKSKINLCLTKTNLSVEEIATLLNASKRTVSDYKKRLE